MQKTARPSYWNKIEQGLRRITNLPSEVHSVLGDSNKIKFHNTIPPGVSSNAKAYVSTEDANDDGDIETINIVVTNLEKEWPQDVLSKINQMDDSDPVFQQILSGIAETLIHEIAHINDYTDGKFPGGEAVAESAENAFNANFPASTATNIIEKEEHVIKTAKNKEFAMKSDLLKLANHLDSIGQHDLADRLEEVVKISMEKEQVSESDASIAQMAAQNVSEEELQGQPNVDPAAPTESPAIPTEEDMMAGLGLDEMDIQALASIMERELSVKGGKVNRN